MISLSHVKKYEQVNLGSKILRELRFFCLFFLILVLTIPANRTFALDESKPALPLEISEKYYKKEAILKFNQAVKEWESMDTALAINSWTEAIKLDPNLWVAYLGLGQAYESEKEYTKALDAYKHYLDIAPQIAPDRKTVVDAVKFLSHLLKNGEEVVKSSDYLQLVKTKHGGRELFVRWDLSKPVKIYFYPAQGVPHYRSEFQEAFSEGAKIWQQALEGLKFEIIDNSILSLFKLKEREKKEKEFVEQAQIKVIFPSRFKIKGDPKNPIAAEIDAQSFPEIRDKKNFRVLGVIMVSPYIYHQSQIAIPLEPLSKLKTTEEQIKKIKIIAAREVGHALGLWGFSPNPDDLMFEGEVTQLKLSDRDKNTLKKLYELDPEKENVLTNF
ncbi:MAG: hypothetical protein A3B68_05355 [Candidatus Melainabacteria bacterium RIFCSPHIGHO2_02_FULL_34_12]|nr:MAG: hypothetical protein A3B68_05355 [Candidatus Melainabacteria bacterium RIFCSPHIGHO2_02_FULL_34_12]